MNVDLVVSWLVYRTAHGRGSLDGRLVVWIWAIGARAAQSIATAQSGRPSSERQCVARVRRMASSAGRSCAGETCACLEEAEERLGRADQLSEAGLWIRLEVSR